MTKIDDSLISKLERLSRLKLADNEKSKIKEDLNSIVAMFDTLQEVDTTDIEPLRHINEDIINRMREDVVNNELSNDDALVNTKNTKDGFIAVPKFLKPK